MVVLVLPHAQLADELVAGREGHSPVELPLVGAMAALDFPVGFRAAGRDVLVGDARSCRCQVKSVPHSEPLSV
jgi:hypothetical protein